MFEVNQYQKRLHTEPPAVPELPYSPSDDIAQMSLLVWGEHCVECASPSCFQTCDLYEPRPDGRCRRFRFGIYKNFRFPSVRGYGAEIAFKKWGIFGAQGNTAMVPKSLLIWEERLFNLASRMLGWIGPLVSRFDWNEGWRYPSFGLSRRISTWLHRRNKGRTKPDAFLLEIYNPGAEAVRMQLGMGYDPHGRNELAKTVQIQPRFRTTLTFPKGYSRHEFDRRLFQSFTETGLPFNIALVPEADTSAKLVILTADFVIYRNKTGAGKSRTAIKCVVWDLDNCLWDGILLENDDVKLKPGMKELLEALDQRGILLSIASKNDHDSAWQRLQALGISEYFLYPQIHWGPKSQSIKTIAQKLNLGLDAFAFVDDNPFELSEVAASIPEICCIHIQDAEKELQGDRFQGAQTADAKNRRRYYQEAIVREEKQAEFGEDYFRFLEYCEIRLEIAGYREEDSDRVAELVQRTNQLNFSGRKYDRAQLREILDDPTVEKYSLHCSDKFGSYGLIGFGLVRRGDGEIQIQDLMLSCRVQGKMIEQAFFSHLEAHHNPQGARYLRVNFKETSRNRPARQSLEAARFEKLDADQGFAREVRQNDVSQRSIVRVECRAGCKNEISEMAAERY